MAVCFVSMFCHRRRLLLDPGGGLDRLDPIQFNSARSDIGLENHTLTHSEHNSTRLLNGDRNWARTESEIRRVAMAIDG